MSFEVAAALLDAVLDLGDPVEVPVDDRLVDEAPEMLGGLEFRVVGPETEASYTVGRSSSCCLRPTSDAPLKRNPFSYSEKGVASRDGRTLAMHKRPLFVSEGAGPEPFRFYGAPLKRQLMTPSRRCQMADGCPFSGSANRLPND